MVFGSYSGRLVEERGQGGSRAESNPLYMAEDRMMPKGERPEWRYMTTIDGGRIPGARSDNARPSFERGQCLKLQLSITTGRAACAAQGPLLLRIFLLSTCQNVAFVVQGPLHSLQQGLSRCPRFQRLRLLLCHESLYLYSMLVFGWYIPPL